MAEIEGTAKSERLHRGMTLAERRRQRREALLDTALELFGTKGYQSTSVEEICRTAFVSTRNFYEEFENREALLMALGDRVVAKAFEAVMSTPQLEGGAEVVRQDAEVRISAIVHALVDDPRVARVTFVEQLGVSPAQEARRREAHLAYARYLSDYLSYYLAEGGAVTPAPDLAAQRRRDLVGVGLVGAMHEILAHWVLSTDPTTIDELIDVLVEIVMVMYAALLAE